MPGNRREEETAFLKRFYFLIFIIVLLDQITKFLALSYLFSGDSIPVIPGIFHLTLVRNTGIAFGFFREHQNALLFFITLSLALMLIWGARMSQAPKLQWVSLTLILGGAIGNWIDRIRFGAVVDFLDFRIWPVFNLADSVITIGVCLILLSLLKASK